MLWVIAVSISRLKKKRNHKKTIKIYSWRGNAIKICLSENDFSYIANFLYLKGRGIGGNY